MSALSHGLQQVKVVALAVSDLGRARQFYGEILGLPPAYAGGTLVGYSIGETVLMLKENWYGCPTPTPNPRITLAAAYAPDTEAFLKTRNVTIADPVAEVDDGYYVGSFLDSEGNKLWFCSPTDK
jgi:Predicted ring-cleavage extradiol dioxygenase